MQDVRLNVLLRDYLAAAREVEQTIYNSATAARIDSVVQFSRELRSEILSREGGLEAFLELLEHERPLVRYWAAVAVRRAEPQRAEAVLSALIESDPDGVGNSAWLTLSRWRRRAAIAPFKDTFFQEWGRIRNLTGKSPQDLARGFAQGALMKENVEPDAEGTAIAHRCWKVMNKLYRAMREREDCRAAFDGLLEHEDASIAVWAAGFLHADDPARAIKVVEAIARQGTGRAKFQAESALEAWRPNW
jgi:hypothetical protein